MYNEIMNLSRSKTSQLFKNRLLSLDRDMFSKKTQRLIDIYISKEQVDTNYLCECLLKDYRGYMVKHNLNKEHIHRYKVLQDMFKYTLSFNNTLYDKCFEVITDKYLFTNGVVSFVLNTDYYYHSKSKNLEIENDALKYLLEVHMYSPTTCNIDLDYLKSTKDIYVKMNDFIIGGELMYDLEVRTNDIRSLCVMFDTNVVSINSKGLIYFEDNYTNMGFIRGYKY